MPVLMAWRMPSKQRDHSQLCNRHMPQHPGHSGSAFCRKLGHKLQLPACHAEAQAAELGSAELLAMGAEASAESDLQTTRQSHDGASWPISGVFGCFRLAHSRNQSTQPMTEPHRTTERLQPGQSAPKSWHRSLPPSSR